MFFSRIRRKSNLLQNKGTNLFCGSGKVFCALLLVSIFISIPQNARAACTNPANPAGVIRYDSAEHMMAYCDGTDWIRMGKDIVFSDPLAASPITLTNPSPSSQDYYGYGVAVDGTTAVIGVPRNDTGGTDTGIAYAFDVTDGSLIATFNNPSPVDSDWFGTSVGISGNNVIIGADRDDTGASSAGIAYVFDLTSPSSPIATLNNPSPVASDFFGRSVAIYGDTAVVGSPYDDTGASDSGIAYVFDINSPATPTATLNHPSPTASDLFGNAVAIEGNIAVVGANADNGSSDAPGTAYAFDVTDGSLIATFNNPNPSADDDFGVSVDISGDNVIIGTPNDDTGVSNAGIAYIFDINSPSSPSVTLNNPSPVSGDLFGYSVSLSGSTALVGIPSDDTGASGAGSAYVFDINSPSSPSLTLNNPSPGISQSFGWPVSMSGNVLIITKRRLEAGPAYAYLLGCTNPSAEEGTIYYNETLHVMQFCNGADWIAMGPQVPDSLTVFVTSSTHNGNVGGLSGADTTCQTRADTAGLTGTYKAWLADDTGNPAGRFAYNAVTSYKGINGATIANNWADLTDGTLLNGIEYDENGTLVAFNGVWTNATSSGSVNSVDDCNDWTDGTNSFSSYGGVTSSTNNWTINGINTCDTVKRLYCFEQYSSNFYGPGSGCVNPTGVEGEMYYNTTYNTMQYCNGYDWIGIRGHKCDTSGTSFTFTDQTDVALNTAITSNTQLISGMGCNTASVSISGASGSPQFRTCDDAGCTVNVSAWQTSGTIDEGQYLQLQMTSANDTSITYNATVTVEETSDTWSITTAPPKTVFVSSGTYKGNAGTGGVAGMNALCQSLADAVPLSGTYKAWISDSTLDARDNLSHATVPYKLVTGTKVADNWTDLVDATLDAPINRDENGTLVTGTENVFTSSDAFGTLYGGGSNACNDWTSGGGGVNSCTGSTDVSDNKWSLATTICTSCAQSRRIYCFEQ